MRGSQKTSIRSEAQGGIIPAHAGLTAVWRQAHQELWDHPRACGAHSAAAPSCVPSGGSSPRMRGSPAQCLRVKGLGGIIPAHAGLTLFMLEAFRVAGDHPRACGAHTGKKIMNSKYTGSSPRMRGSRECPAYPCVVDGIIPAHAGLTLLWTAFS